MVKSFEAHNGGFHGIKILPNGYVATSGYIASSGYDATVRIWNPLIGNTWTLVQTFTDYYNDYKYVSDFEYINLDQIATLLTYFNNKLIYQQIKIWSISSGETLKTIGDNRTLSGTRLKLLNDGIRLAVGLNNGSISIYNIDSGSLITNYQGHNGSISDLELISNSNFLASSSYDKTVRIWDVTTNTCKYVLKGHTDGVTALKQISSDMFASVSWDQTIKFWNITTGQLIRTLKDSMYSSFSIDVLSNNEKEQILVSISNKDTIKLWNITTGMELNSKKMSFYDKDRPFGGLNIVISNSTTKLGNQIFLFVLVPNFIFIKSVSKFPHFFVLTRLTD